MPVDIGANGVMGIGFETTPGTYAEPTMFIPFNSESIKWTQENIQRRPIRASASLIGFMPTYGSVEGDIEVDATADIVAFFMHIARCKVVKTEATSPYTYVFTPTSSALAPKTASITIKRNDEVFGYTGCVVHGFVLSIDDGVLKMTVNVLGSAESPQPDNTPTWPSSSTFGPGSYVLEIPTATQIFDADSYELSVSDNGEAQNRISNTIGASFIKLGERSVEVSTERDFVNRAEYDEFKNGTAKSITMKATKGADNEVSVVTPVAYIDTYEVNIGGQGDLIRASVKYICAIDAAGVDYTMTVKTTLNVT